MIERPGLALGALGALALLLAACRPDPDACCRSDDDCAAGAACFEGMCAPRCTHPSQCGEGERCGPGGVCVATGRVKGHCSFSFGGGGPSGRVDAGGASSDAGASDDAGAPGACVADPLEPNDSPQQASIDFAPVEVLSICAGDEDWFAIGASAGETIAARIEFVHERGDLDLKLLHGGREVAISQGITDVEEITHVAAEAGTYLVQVYGFGGAENRYELALAGVPPPVLCRDDPFEENDNADEAHPLVIGQAVEAELCPTDGADFFLVDPRVQTETVITLRYTAPPAMRLTVSHPEFGTLVSESGTGLETVSAFGAAEGSALLLVEVSGVVPDVEGRSYELSAAVVDGPCDDGFEPNDNASSATLFPIPGRFDAALCGGDVDTYRLEFVPMGIVTVSLVSPGGATARLVRESDGTTLFGLESDDLVPLDLNNEQPGDILLVVAGDPLSSIFYTVEILSP